MEIQRAEPIAAGPPVSGLAPRYAAMPAGEAALAVAALLP